MSPLFERIVCGVDGTEESLEAVRQATRLRAEDGTLHLFSAVHLAATAAAGWSAPRLAAEFEREAAEALRAAEALAGGAATTRLVDGPAVGSLLREIERERATLLCVGTHERRRLEGVLFDYVGTTMVHEAPCAVLVAREPADPDAFPRAIAVGVDGSPNARDAHRVAVELAERFDATVTPIVATRDRAPIDVDALRREIPRLTVVDAVPVDALVHAAAAADLLVVGSRGLTGVRALGSVGERVAHRARCSVLVVRPLL